MCMATQSIPRQHAAALQRQQRYRLREAVQRTGCEKQDYDDCAYRQGTAVVYIVRCFCYRCTGRREI